MFPSHFIALSCQVTVVVLASCFTRTAEAEEHIGHITQSVHTVSAIIAYVVNQIFPEKDQ